MTIVWEGGRWGWEEGEEEREGWEEGEEERYDICPVR